MFLLLLASAQALVRFEPALNYEQFSWYSARPARPDELVSFTISLTQRNIPELKRRALEVNTPGHETYGQYLTTSEIANLTAPDEMARSTVAAWLRNYGIPASFEHENVRISCKCAGLAAELLHTSFFQYKHKGSSKELVRASRGYSLPDHVAPHVATIFGLHGIPAPRLTIAPRASNLPPAANVTPSVLWQTYSIDAPYASRTGKGSQAVAEFQGQRMNKDDLVTFFKEEVPQARQGDDQVSKFVGETPYERGDGIEALLDVEFIMGVAPGVATEFWEWPSNDFCFDLHGYTATMLATAAPPLVNSISYGWQGELTDLNCQSSDKAAIEANWAKLAAAGISVLISSGDTGPGYKMPGCKLTSGNEGVEVTRGTVRVTYPKVPRVTCCVAGEYPARFGWMWTPHQEEASVDGQQLLGNCTVYSEIEAVGPAANPHTVTDENRQTYVLYPSWPASSPWVTAVGATRFVGQVVGGEEMATDQFGSGGGFSADFDQTHAPWQSAAVAKYVAMGASLPKFPTAGSFPPQGRATPDIAALGEGFQVIADGTVRPVGGTSASAPSIAAMISLLNEARFKAGKPQMGFLNPFLYANPDAFFDVVKGTNAYQRSPSPTPVGYACAPGWDAATGLGTPHFDKLLQAALAAYSKPYLK